MLSPAEVIRRTQEIIPTIKARASETEALRRIPEDTARLLSDAGLFRLYQPSRFGGFELPFGTLQLALSKEIGAACGSTAWVQSVLAIHGWMLGSFTDEAQEAVWAQNTCAVVATAVSPADGRATREVGGLRLDGTWEFSSGCELADWIVFRASVKDAAQGSNYWCLVPRSAVEIVDVWYATGLRGSGSQSVRVRNVFVPSAFTLDVTALRGSTRPLYGLPYIGAFQFAIAVPAIGIAKGSLALFQSETRQRPDRRAQSARQIRFARSAAEVDAAELLLARMAKDFESATAECRLLGTEDRIRFKRDASFAVYLCRTAVDRLVEVLGAHGVADSNPIQRAHRDIAAIASHHGLAWDVSGEIFGSFAFGVDPSDPMLLVG